MKYLNHPTISLNAINLTLNKKQNLHRVILFVYSIRTDYCFRSHDCDYTFTG